MNNKVVHIVGARPQIIKAAPVSRALRTAGLNEVLVHTGQHYDSELSDLFFNGLDVPKPNYNLGVGSGSHGVQTARMLEGIEKVIVAEKPGLVLVPGDTNSTVAAALAATKLKIPVAHIEAGLRSFDMGMAEEINRRVTDHIATLLFAPTETAVENLRREGVPGKVVRTGDVMYDLFLVMLPKVLESADSILQEFDLADTDYAFFTLHRAENTDDPRAWAAVKRGLRELGRRLPVVWPVHPRAANLLGGFQTEGVTMIDPQPYVTTQALVRNARVVVTDSGGLQKEAAFNGRPCVTLREHTEWVELITAGVSRLAPPGHCDWWEAVGQASWPEEGIPDGCYGSGAASREIMAVITRFFRGEIESS
ncbi:MAG: UDP-N-acetylglucosamine 2-epimerase (non-hydrolyzing) [Thermoanaerobaculales bacterium]|nr:UDP-N-acetylglucosamine 2-epimerase (non-hydrolyzing) [Thermoanaerobaculales bacterium]